MPSLYRGPRSEWDYPKLYCLLEKMRLYLQFSLIHFSLLKFHDCFIGSIELAHQRNECLYVLVRCNKQCYGLTDIFVEVRSIARGIMKKLPSLWFISIPCLVENVIGCRKLTAKISSVVQTGRSLNIVLVTSAIMCSVMAICLPLSDQ